MTIVQPTLKHLLMIWFSITLRAVGLGVLGAVIASIIIGICVIATGGGQDQIQSLARLVGPVIGLPVSLYSVYAQLGRKCGGVRLVLVSAD